MTEQHDGTDHGAQGPTGDELVEVLLERVISDDVSDRQHIYLRERGKSRIFPIVIGSNEVSEIERIVNREEPSQRPLTHRLLFDALTAVGAKLVGVDVVALENGTFYARLRVVPRDGDGEWVEVDARPSDAIALALRARCPIRVASSVLDEASPDLDD